MQLQQFQSLTWCFDKNLGQARQKNPQHLPKDGYMNNSWVYEQLLGNLLYFSEF